ncbi:MAG: elongation factor 1-beta [Candidatus Micrarchaeia archaeon]
MGKVAVSMKIFLEDQSKLGETLEAVKKLVDVKSSKTEDIGFGITALKILFVMDDQGGMESVEEKIASIPNVSQAQTEDVSLL